MPKAGSPDLSVTMDGVRFKSPIGVGPVGFPWGKEMPKHPELHAEVLLKHIQAGAGYIVLSGMFVKEKTIKKVLEKAKYEEAHHMPEGGTRRRIIRAPSAPAPYGLEGMFYLDTPFMIGVDLARRAAADTEKLVKIVMEKKPKDVPFIGNIPGLADEPDSWVDGAKRWEELGADTEPPEDGRETPAR